MRARRLRLLVLAAVALAALVVAVGLGPVRLPPARVAGILAEGLRAWRAEGGLEGLLERDAEARIVWQIRLPRVLLGALVGACLGASGAAYQGLFRNPMADPYVLGVSSGAALGASLALSLAGRGLPGAPELVPAVAFAFALGASGAVYLLARVGGRLPVLPLLLAGTAVASCLGALVSLVVYLSGERMRPIVFWLLGSLSGANWREVGVVAGYAAVGLAVLLSQARALDALSLGEEPAHYLGIQPERTKKAVVAAGALLAAAAVSVSGIIGFVGLVVPHAVRLWLGPDHRGVLPGSALAGAALMVLADAAARSALPPLEVPVGVVTALAGSPAFVALLRLRLRQGQLL